MFYVCALCYAVKVAYNQQSGVTIVRDETSNDPEETPLLSEEEEEEDSLNSNGKVYVLCVCVCVCDCNHYFVLFHLKKKKSSILQISAFFQKVKNQLHLIYAQMFLGGMWRTTVVLWTIWYVYLYTILCWEIFVLLAWNFGSWERHCF